MSYVPVCDESAVLLKVAEGDEKAFCALFDQYHQLLASHIMKITRSAELTEEIVQDVFLKIWVSREALTEIRNLRSYLFIVSKNHALNSLKKVARDRANFLDANWELLEKTFTSPEPETSDYYSLIDEAINHLPPQQKKVYLLSRHERMKYSEIAEELNLSRETVKKYLQLATEAISTRIKAELSKMALLILLIFI